MTMIEKVARAICGHEQDKMVLVGNFIGEPAEYPRWMLFMPDARRAITAMREPTSAMRDAYTDNAQPDDSQASIYLDMFGYGAMIDAALEEK